MKKLNEIPRKKERNAEAKRNAIDVRLNCVIGTDATSPIMAGNSSSKT